MTKVTELTHKTRVLTAALSLLLAPALAVTDEPTSLQAIMQGLGDNLSEIADGLMADDLELVGHAAAGIADHPRIPPEQVQLVARELGDEMAAFKQFDMQVHDLAVEIGAAARAGDSAVAMDRFQAMIAGCFGCHVAYKDRLAAVLRPVAP
jgi:cytochrome c556